MKTFNDYLEGQVISIKKAITKEDYQKFVNDFFSLMEQYNLHYNKDLVNLFLNELHAKNIKEYK